MVFLYSLQIHFICQILCIYKEPRSFSTMFSDKMNIIIIFFKLVHFVNKISTRLLPLNKLLPFAIGVS